MGAVEPEAIYAVILTEPAAFNPSVVAKVLVEYKKVPMPDAMHVARRLWGIIEEKTTGEEALKLKLCLEGAGLASMILPFDVLAPLPGEEMVKKAVFSDVGLKAECRPGSIDEFLWADLKVVGAAGIHQQSISTTTETTGPSAAVQALNMGILLSTGIPIKFGGKKKTVEKTEVKEELVFFLDLLFRNPARRLRIDAQNFDYSFLEARKTYSAYTNYRMLVGDVAQAASGALHSRGTRILLERMPVSNMGYESLIELERECRWLFTLGSL
ncbi:MAG: hypothetical protein LHV69_09025 [Elusimicrobia bacterium]|nr:hypothetical protein [Candidatus Obscuribacterium magneticum]